MNRVVCGYTYHHNNTHHYYSHYTHIRRNIMSNPYEMRYDIYNSAKDRLMEQYHQDHALWQDHQEWKREQETEGHTITVECDVPSRPQFPTHEDIVEEAKKIYSFVSTQ